MSEEMEPCDRCEEETEKRLLINGDGLCPKCRKRWEEQEDRHTDDLHRRIGW